MARIEIAKKTDLDGKADVGHTHDEYAPADHNHDGTYAPVDHTHSEYAPTNHSHDYSEISGTPNIPTDNSQLDNGAGYITGSYDNSNSGLTATDIQSAIDELKALIDGLGGA